MAGPIIARGAAMAAKAAAKKLAKKKAKKEAAKKAAKSTKKDTVDIEERLKGLSKIKMPKVKEKEIEKLQKTVQKEMDKMGYNKGGAVKVDGMQYTKYSKDKKGK